MRTYNKMFLLLGIPLVIGGILFGYFFPKDKFIQKAESASSSTLTLVEKQNQLLTRYELYEIQQTKILKECLEKL